MRGLSTSLRAMGRHAKLSKEDNGTAEEVHFYEKKNPSHWGRSEYGRLQLRDQLGTRSRGTGNNDGCGLQINTK